jgi:hypothetical protein
VQPKQRLPIAVAPTLADALDREADLLAARAAQNAGVQPTDEDDDEFAFDTGDTPPAPTTGASTAATGAFSTSSSLVGAAAASDALGAVRAALAAAAAAEAARERTEQDARAAREQVEREARLAASMLVGGSGGAPEALAPVGEDDEEEEEEEVEEGGGVEQSGSSSGVGAAAPAASPTSSLPLLPHDEEKAALEDAFAGATAAALAAAAGAGVAPAAPAAIVPSCDAEAALLDAASLAPFFVGITPAAVDPSLGCLGRLLAARTPPHLVPHRDAVFALARRPFDGAAPLQARVLDGVYALLTGDSSSAPGAAWTTIGFQREGDFSTDLRGVGMLGPLLVLHALQHHGGAARALWALATQPLHPFPFMVQCLALSAKALHALRLGKLNAALARGEGGGGEGSGGGGGGNPVLRLLHKWFAGLCADFAAAWRGDPAASIMRIGHIQAAVVAEAHARPEGVLRRLEAAEKAEAEGAKKRAAREGGAGSSE